MSTQNKGVLMNKKYMLFLSEEGTKCDNGQCFAQRLIVAHKNFNCIAHTHNFLVSFLLKLSSCGFQEMTTVVVAEMNAVYHMVK